MDPPTNMSNGSIRRLMRDVKNIASNPLTDNGIYYSHDECDMTKGYAMIVGPVDTLYFGGFYFFQFEFPPDYPFSPPRVKFMTHDGKTRFNPNLYVGGKVCISILNTWAGDKWTSCLNIGSILLTICSLLTNAPLLNEPSCTVRNIDYEPYNKSIRFLNLSFAVCHYMQSIDNVPLMFQIFYPHMKSIFVKNWDKHIALVDEYIHPFPRNVVVGIYNMNTCIDYMFLKKRLMDLKCNSSFICTLKDV